MKTKIVYILDKTKDEDMEYANVLDAMIVATNIAGTTGEAIPFEHEIVEDYSNGTVEYRFTIEGDIADGLLDTDEVKQILANFMGEL